jgi:glutamine synthetase
MTIAEADAFLAEGGYQFIRFEQPDLHGMSRSKTVPVAEFGYYEEHELNFLGGLLGIDLQGGVASGTGYLEERNFPDTLIRPDMSTLSAVPWVPGTARTICTPFWYDGSAVGAAPRHLLQRMLAQLADMGYGVRSGFEYEVYFINAESRQPSFGGIQIFWTLRNNFDQEFLDFLLLNLMEMGIRVRTSNAEYGPGQMEITFAPADGVRAADDAFTFKNGVKEMAHRAGYMASFMTKPYAAHSASGCHYHHALIDQGTGNNAFSDASAPDGLSKLCRHWIAGQLVHARAVAALAAPTINCPKRFKLYSFAPVNATWGHEDRTAAIRIKGGRGEETRVENRIPCAGSNPYLVGAAVLAAGLDGVRRELEPPPANTRMAYLDETSPRLPQTLDEAIDALEGDAELRAALGEEFIKLFTAVKRHEIETARGALPEYASPSWPDVVTDWERENMFEYL